MANEIELELENTMDNLLDEDYLSKQASDNIVNSAIENLSKAANEFELLGKYKTAELITKLMERISYSVNKITIKKAQNKPDIKVLFSYMGKLIEHGLSELKIYLDNPKSKKHFKWELEEFNNKYERLGHLEMMLNDNPEYFEDKDNIENAFRTLDADISFILNFGLMGLETKEDSFKDLLEFKSLSNKLLEKFKRPEEFEVKDNKFIDYLEDITNKIGSIQDNDSENISNPEVSEEDYYNKIRPEGLRQMPEYDPGGMMPSRDIDEHMREPAPWDYQNRENETLKDEDETFKYYSTRLPSPDVDGSEYYKDK